MDTFEPTSLFDLSTCPFVELFKDSPYAWDALKRIKEFLHTLPLGKIEGNVSEHAYLIDRDTIYIGPGAKVEPGAYIQGPCYIGAGTEVRHGAYLRGNVIVGDKCVVGHDTEVKNSLFLRGAKAGHFAYVGDSILGNDVNLGAGTKLANLRLDEGIVQIHWKGKKISTGLKKFGALLGDRVQTGCNSVTNPGTIMGKNSACYPCVNVGGIIPPKKVITHSGQKLERQ